MKSKERLTDILLSFDAGAVIYGYRSDGASLELFGKDGETLTPSYAAVGIGYERDSGKYKSTTRVTVDPTYISENIQGWIARYDKVFAVDTNTIDFGNQKLSVTCCVRAEFEFIANNCNVRIDVIDALVVFNPKAKPELIGWLDVISRINDDPKSKIGLIVDSELGSIPEINRRCTPILDNIYLPPNIELIYASSDLDKNLPFNRLIAKCDSDASLLLKKIEEDPERLKNLHPSCEERYESSYYWTPVRHI